MSKIYEKYRDLITNPFDIKYKNIEIKEIISYPPAGNDVVECLCKIGKDALLHVSQISRAHVEKPSDALSVGQEITAKVVDLNEAEKKISLSMKALEPETVEAEEETAE